MAGRVALLVGIWVLYVLVLMFEFLGDFYRISVLSFEGGCLLVVLWVGISVDLGVFVFGWVWVIEYLLLFGCKFAFYT